MDRLTPLEQYLVILSRDLIHENEGKIETVTPFSVMSCVLDDIEFLLTQTEQKVN